MHTNANHPPQPRPPTTAEGQKEKKRETGGAEREIRGQKTKKNEKRRKNKQTEGGAHGGGHMELAGSFFEE